MHFNIGVDTQVNADAVKETSKNEPLCTIAFVPAALTQKQHVHYCRVIRREASRWNQVGKIRSANAPLLRSTSSAHLASNAS